LRLSKTNLRNEGGPRVHELSDIAAGSRWRDFDSLTEPQCEAFAKAYKWASPFPHLVIDQLFAPIALRALEQEFETAPSDIWHEFRGGLQRKRGTAPGARLPSAVQEYFNFLNSGPFLRFLSRVTGIDDLIPDPALYGGGMHQVETGGNFEIHLDFITHPRTRLTNRLVVITYLNENWVAEDGGALELWELKPARRGASVLPEFGRTVIMEQSSRAAHGHPSPIREGRHRRSVIAYFYTNGLARGHNGVLKTVYVSHPGHSQRQRAERYLRQVLPEFAIKGLKFIRSVARARPPGRP
jgi:hypothetical protein